jgi:hypothetical protein
MSSQFEHWVYVRDGEVVYRSENDGWAALRKGLQVPNWVSDGAFGNNPLPLRLCFPTTLSSAIYPFA